MSDVNQKTPMWSSVRGVWWWGTTPASGVYPATTESDEHFVPREIFERLASGRPSLFDNGREYTTRQEAVRDLADATASAKIEKIAQRSVMSSGNKYHRRIYGLKAHGGGAVTVDVYAVLSAFGVTCPALQHCAKKVLCAGIRGKGDRVQDLREARDALDRAIEDAEREAKG